MGYILPFQHFTYNDYQKRMQHIKMNDYHIQGPYPIVKTNHRKFTFDQKYHKQQKIIKNVPGNDLKGQNINVYV